MNIGRASINRERARQITVEGYDFSHDDLHASHQLYLGAECYHTAGDIGRYILANEVPSDVIPVPSYWPFEKSAWKPGVSSRRNFEKAGAMYLAELERLKRAGDKEPEYAAKCQQYVVVCEDKINVGLSQFVRAFNDQTELSYQNSVAHGFHDTDVGDGERLLLMVCEIAEANEGRRHGNPPSDHIPEFSAMEEELADVCIRAMDMSEKGGFRLAEAIAAKHQFNVGRPYKHGKKF